MNDIDSDCKWPKTIQNFYPLINKQQQQSVAVLWVFLLWAQGCNTRVHFSHPLHFSGQSFNRKLFFRNSISLCPTVWTIRNICHSFPIWVHSINKGYFCQPCLRRPTQQPSFSLWDHSTDNLYFIHKDICITSLLHIFIFVVFAPTNFGLEFFTFSESYKPFRHCIRRNGSQEFYTRINIVLKSNMNKERSFCAR
jgi:hypothetical protein